MELDGKRKLEKERVGKANDEMVDIVGLLQTLISQYMHY
jgi:hypothetical protein